jgi:hypothetical protein
LFGQDIALQEQITRQSAQLSDSFGLRMGMRDGGVLQHADSGQHLHHTLHRAISRAHSL